MTTDPQDELFDVLDADGNPTGVSKRRGDVHRDGDWHGALHIWVVTSAGQVLFQRRSATKDTWPNHLDVTIGGHLRAGETIADALREAEEEIGLSMELGDLVPLGRRFTGGGHGAVIDREVQEIFAVINDQPLGDYLLHPEEVASLVAVDIDAIEALLLGEESQAPAIECPRGGASRPVTLTPADMIPVSPRFVAALCSALREIVDGVAPGTWELRDLI